MTQWTINICWEIITECTIDLLVDISTGVFNTFRNTEDAPNFTSVKTKLKINGTSTGPCHDGYGRSSYQVDAIKNVEDPRSAHT